MKDNKRSEKGFTEQTIANTQNIAVGDAIYVHQRGLTKLPRESVNFMETEMTDHNLREDGGSITKC